MGIADQCLQLLLDLYNKSIKDPDHFTANHGDDAVDLFIILHNHIKRTGELPEEWNGAH